MNKELRGKAKSLSPILSIGKNGITTGVVGLVKKELRAKRLIKIKFLKSALAEKDRRALGKELVDKTGATCVEQVGHVIVLHK